MLRSVGSFSKTVGLRLRNAGGYVPGQRIIALADGRKFWATRVPRSEWADLQLSDELLHVCAKHAHVPFPACIEMATVLGNHAGTEALALAWGWCAEGPVYNRPTTVLYYRELESILRYELHETGCSDVVSTIIPNPN